jgi:hypothetical protein
MSQVCGIDSSSPFKLALKRTCFLVANRFKISLRKRVGALQSSKNPVAKDLVFCTPEILRPQQKRETSAVTVRPLRRNCADVVSTEIVGRSAMLFTLLSFLSI